MTNQARGYLIATIAAVFWSLTGILIRYLNVEHQMPPFLLAFWRDLFVGSGLAIFFLIFRSQPLMAMLPTVGRQHGWFFLAFSFILANFNALWTLSVQLNGAAAATVLAYSSPAFTAVLAWRIFGEPLGGGKISAVVLGIIGCILVSGAYALAVWQVNPIGILTGLLSGLAFASYSLMGRSAANRSINSWLALMVSFGGAAVLLLAFNLIAAQVFPGLGSTNLFWLGDSLTGWLALLFLALGPSIGGFGLFTLSLNYLPASIASLIAILELPLTAVMAYLFLSERLNQPQLVGCVLIVGSIFLLRFADRPTSALAPSISP